MLFKHARNSSCFWNTPQYPSANTLVSFIFHSAFLFPVYGDILSSRLCGQSLYGHFWQQKRNGPERVPFHTACGNPQICFSQDGNTHPAETKKVPKDCHVYTWYPLTLLTILNSVCPGSPKKEPEPAGWHAACGHTGYVLPVSPYTGVA